MARPSTPVIIAECRGIHKSASSDADAITAMLARWLEADFPIDRIGGRRW